MWNKGQCLPGGTEEIQQLQQDKHSLQPDMNLELPGCTSVTGSIINAARIKMNLTD
jgi:hypothetical protein